MYDFARALADAVSGSKLETGAIKALLMANPEQTKSLYSAADRTRQTGVGDEVHLRAIIEFSNYCRKNCLYCGLRRDNKSIARYRLSLDEILTTATEAVALGFRTVVLQSGEDLYYTPEDIARLVYSIKNKHDVAITLSLGEHRRENYRLWREAGADRYLLKHETANPELFRFLKPDTTFETRLRCLHWLKELDYQTGSGNMVGLPGQDLDTLARDVALLRDLDVEMAGVGPFLPHYATPLKDAAAGDPELTLKTLAVTRLCLPGAHLPATTALCTLATDGRKLALNAGANVIMPNLTPLDVRRQYQIYPQKSDMTEKPLETLTSIKKLLAGLARPLATSHGHAPKFTGGMKQ
ncbi:[FeFe] hydrogenase H-cluster radical SAM maturase HydE [Desulfallas thermosapovorans]|uniref:Iron-only hydrogenase maturation protein HydE n=1 Tax=Desulfallas thermosapovorans DSM 6562 TaxID=1121431 RepID=A0A5S4ZT63_9FIRM|nr:[FeFe] hydrogenase H-cluster radical SAM maturase HydE [Desulfallas thermosapovorans]TYO95361.1 iron-only hydrogenase maturation protein HydE [Desulfallas thermosapovorans DSM 6562]